jgi:hypothetical protein
MNDKPNVSDVVDTTDCLEAIGAFKAMKNLFFLAVFLCMVVLQGIFWLNHLGYIDVSDAPVDAVAVVADVEVADEAVVEVVKGETALVGAAIGAGVGEVVSEVAANGVKIDEQADEAEKVALGSTELEPVELVVAEEVSAKSWTKFVPKYEYACIVIRVCNFVLIITATIYCLILLMSVKISLVGRLGGISHISRAFFLSLIALIILLPWQALFSGIALGGIYVPAELFSKMTLTDESTILCKVLYFARFTGMWGISMLLLLAAQARSAKWSKTTLRRLGMLR